MIARSFSVGAGVSTTVFLSLGPMHRGTRVDAVDLWCDPSSLLANTALLASVAASEHEVTDANGFVCLRPLINNLTVDTQVRSGIFNLPYPLRNWSRFVVVRLVIDNSASGVAFRGGAVLVYHETGPTRLSGSPRLQSSSDGGS